VFSFCSIIVLLEFDRDFLPGTGGVHQCGDEKTTKGTSFKNDKRINKIHNNPPTLTEL